MEAEQNQDIIFSNVDLSPLEGLKDLTCQN
jgi:hypothetical protein